MKDTQIKQIEAKLYAVPLPEVLCDAKHGDHTHFELVTVTVALENGCRGTGYTYTGGKGGRAIHAMVKYDLAPALIGKDGSDIEEIYDFMEWHIHYVGRGGMRHLRFRLWTLLCGIFGVRLPASLCGKWRGAHPIQPKPIAAGLIWRFHWKSC